MEHNLMAPDEMRNLGFKDEHEIGGQRGEQNLKNTTVVGSPEEEKMRKVT